MLQAVGGSYRRKIKTVDELCDVIGSRPRAKKVIMCHGVFDLVHPGHIRHLLYAKDKADILVASLTADAYITKAQYRPFVPQELRALNLAALEMVDFVVIDLNPTPITNIARIQPDYFAKGYEYGNGGVNPKTQEELEVIQSYGGELLFTPGDIVYSSSHLIENDPPNIALEKFLRIVETCEGKRVHVVGDTIVDSLTYTTMIGGMTKTPTPSVRFDNRTDFVGGAGIVAKHLKSAGADVTLSTVLGDDSLAEFALKDLEGAGVNIMPIIDRARPTTNKNAYVCGDYRLLKVDTLDNRSITDKQAEMISGQIANVHAEAVVFSDFRHGIFNRRTISGLTGVIPQGAFRVADSQVASRWGNILEFKGFDLLTPNEREARFALADQDTGVRPLAAKLHEEADCKTVILKLGDRGVLTCRRGTK